MALPHYSEDATQRKGKNFEPVQGNLFEVTLLPPAGVGAKDPLYLQHVKSIAGLDAMAPGIEAIGQKYKFAERSFAGMPGTTSVDLTITFTSNLNDSNQAYLYKALREWYRLAYNPETGEMGLKKNYVGTIVVVQFNREGDIYRKVTFDDCFITSPVNLNADLNYETADAVDLEVIWKCDTYSEELN